MKKPLGYFLIVLGLLVIFTAMCYQLLLYPEFSQAKALRSFMWFHLSGGAFMFMGYRLITLGER